MTDTTGGRKWTAFLLAAIGIFMATLDGSIVNIALPTIMRDLKVVLADIEWVVMIYLLTVSCLLLSFGRLSDIKGRRWVYSRGLLLFAVGSLLCGVAQTVLWLITARLFQGVGAAMIMACTPALVVDVFPAEERGRALGMVGTVVASGLTVGPTLGGFILHFFSWRVIFFINIPIGLAAAWAANFFLAGGRADVRRAETFDWWGAVFLALCFGPLLLAISHGYEWGYGSRRVILLGALSMISALGFVRLESRVNHPVFDLALVRIRLFILPILAAIILFTSLFCLVFLMPFYLLLPHGFSESQAGLIMSTIFVFLFLISPVSGAVSDKIGSRAICTIGMAVLALALFSLTQLGPDAPFISICWRLALAGVGTAIFIPPNSSAAMSSVPFNRRGLASGTVAAARNLGMVLGIGLAGAIFNTVFHARSSGLSLQVYSPGLEPAFMAAFRWALAAGGLAALLGLAVSYLRGPESIRRQ